MYGYTDTTERPEITRKGLISMQVCVPKDWTDEQVEEYADYNNPTDISSSWKIRKKDNKLLLGYEERVMCSNNENKVHIVLEC